jgi:hypothetical protein
MLAGAAAMLGPAGAQAAESASAKFETTGEHTFVVPAGVTSVQVMLVGGSGGGGKGGAPGGIPATVTATLAVSPGEILYAEVAGNGQTASAAEQAGGYDGGGAGGERALGGTGGGGGGGASDIRTCPASAPPPACSSGSSLTSRLIVAGGGGGGGGNGLEPSSTSGGIGGPADQEGFGGKKDGGTDVGGSPGLRGTSVAGGAAGGPSAECEPKTGFRCPTGGQLGSGGTGGGGAFGGGGGGGGGGINGGGGAGGGAATGLANGGGGGGGGGASGVPPGGVGISRVSGNSLVATAPGAQPAIELAWIMPAPTVQTEAPTAVTSSGATLNGIVNPDGSQVSDCHFAAAPAPPGGASIPCLQQIGGGSTPVAVSASLAGLAPATAYTIRLVAASAQGTTTGGPVTLLTAIATASSASATSGSGGALSVSGLRLSPSRFRRGKHVATLARAKKRAKALPTATTISFTLAAAAAVTLTFERPQTGVLVGHKCVARTKAHRRNRSCTRYVRAAGAVRRSAHAGADRIRFEGVLDGGNALAPGAYRLLLAASAAGVTTTAAQHPTFTFVK